MKGKYIEICSLLQKHNFFLILWKERTSITIAKSENRKECSDQLVVSCKSSGRDELRDADWGFWDM